MRIAQKRTKSLRGCTECIGNNNNRLCTKFPDCGTPSLYEMEKHMFTISTTLMQQCIDMVAKEQDYIPFPDGLEADYSVYNIHGDGVWIVDPWATEGGDYIKIQETVLSAPKRAT